MVTTRKKFSKFHVKKNKPMNEPIIKYPIFSSNEEKAYQRYYELAKEYTTPLTFEQWKNQVFDIVAGC